MTDEPPPIRRYPERVTADQLKRRFPEWKQGYQLVLVGERIYRKDTDGWWYLLGNTPVRANPHLR
jgi:hypothetical protein